MATMSIISIYYCCSYFTNIITIHDIFRLATSDNRYCRVRATINIQQQQQNREFAMYMSRTPDPVIRWRSFTL